MSISNISFIAIFRYILWLDTIIGKNQRRINVENISIFFQQSFNDHINDKNQQNLQIRICSTAKTM